MAGVPIAGDFGIEFPLTVVAPKTRGAQRVWYVPNHRSFGAFMRSEQMRDVTEEVAKDIAHVAAELSPVDTGDLASSFKVKREAGLMKVGGNLRVKVLVENNSDHAAANEFGIGRLGPRGRRMLLRAGARFGDTKLGPEEGA